jgi:imidazolonepropionase
MLRCGTTTAEVKSGYGLTLESELTQLRAIRRLATEQPMELEATFMGAHEIPSEYRDNRDDYIRLIVDSMIPAVAAERLATWCDVFCEEGVFTPDEAASILAAGRGRVSSLGFTRTSSAPLAERRWPPGSAPAPPTISCSSPRLKRGPLQTRA